MEEETQEVRTTIPRVLNTPKLLIKVRGKECKALQPEIGSVVVMADNGYSPAIGHKSSYVCTYRKMSKSGAITSIRVSYILAITEDSVTYDSSKNGFVLNLYTNGGWVRWNDHPTHSLYHYTWDEYKETVTGDYNK